MQFECFVTKSKEMYFNLHWKMLNNVLYLIFPSFDSWNSNLCSFGTVLATLCLGQDKAKNIYLSSWWLLLAIGLRILWYFGVCCKHWHTQKKFHGGFHSVAHGGHLYWCALFVTSQFDVIFMFPNQHFGEVCWHNMHILLHALLIYVSMHWINEYKLSAFQVRTSEENTLNATAQPSITAKISGCPSKQASKKHSSMRQSKLQTQNQAVLMSCRIRAGEHRKFVAGLAGAHPGLQDRILLNYTGIENAHKLRKKTLNFTLSNEVQQTFSFLFSLLRHFQMPWILLC